VAKSVPISGGPETAKIRSIWAVALLTWFTFGIYFLAWYYMINRELRDLGHKRHVQGLGDSPATSLLTIALSAIGIVVASSRPTYFAFVAAVIILVPAIMSLIGTFNRIKLAQQVVGIDPVNQINGWAVLIGILLFDPAAWAYEQSALNNVWKIDQLNAH
jgi:Domain of unknown function (DUF4234)